MGTSTQGETVALAVARLFHICHRGFQSRERTKKQNIIKAECEYYLELKVGSTSLFLFI